MNETLEGMARVEFYARSADGWSYDEMCEQIPNGFHEENIEVVRVALLWLANNVTDEMAEALFATFGLAAKPTFWPSQHSDWDIEWCKTSIAAALRAAAGDGR